VRCGHHTEHFAPPHFAAAPNQQPPIHINQNGTCHGFLIIQNLPDSVLQAPAPSGGKKQKKKWSKGKGT